MTKNKLAAVQDLLAKTKAATITEEERQFLDNLEAKVLKWGTKMHMTPKQYARLEEYAGEL